MKIRKPVISGTFYPGSEKEIRQMIERILDSERSKIDLGFSNLDIIGAVVPHAGYIYSAYEAVHFYELLRKTEKEYDTFIIINPNHTGYGESIEIDSHDAWNTPMGDVPLDTEFIKQMDLPVSNRAQMQEHSAEVMLPLLQIFVPNPFKIIPISILRQNPGTSFRVAEQIFRVNQQFNRRLMVIASSDFSHFTDPETGAKLDDLVLEQIENQNPEKLHQAVISNRISVCGYGPIMAVMEYAKLVAKKPLTSVLARGHSGKTRPSDSVVDYNTILFFQKPSAQH